MDVVKVKSKVGNFEIRRRETNEKGFLPPKLYRFSPDFVTELPIHVWKDLEFEHLDRNIGLRYREALQTL